VFYKQGHRRIADAAHLRDGTANPNTTNTTIHTEHKEIAEYRIIQEHPHEHNTTTTSAGNGHTPSNGGTVSSVTAAGGKVRFANPFGISTEDVNTVDKVKLMLFGGNDVMGCLTHARASNVHIYNLF